MSAPGVGVDEAGVLRGVACGMVVMLRPVPLISSLCHLMSAALHSAFLVLHKGCISASFLANMCLCTGDWDGGFLYSRRSCSLGFRC